MFIRDLFEYNAWHGPDDQWHNQGQDDQWHGTDDMWHGREGAGMVEDYNTANMVTTESSFSDVLNARDLINTALRDPQNEKYKYFEFLKNLRTRHGVEYSTDVHKRASELAKQR